MSTYRAPTANDRLKNRRIPDSRKENQGRCSVSVVVAAASLLDHLVMLVAGSERRGLVCGFMRKTAPQTVLSQNQHRPTKTIQSSRSCHLRTQYPPWLALGVPGQAPSPIYSSRPPHQVSTTAELQVHANSLAPFTYNGQSRTGCRVCPTVFSPDYRS